jgi:hypothetical protein
MFSILASLSPSNTKLKASLAVVSPESAINQRKVLGLVKEFGKWYIGEVGKKFESGEIVLYLGDVVLRLGELTVNGESCQSRVV